VAVVIDRIVGDRIAVVVPARDEADRIDACLRSINEAAARVPAPVEVVVVADGCLDDTAARARRHGATVLETSGSNVGGARAAGVAHALARGTTWIASTDADSTVPENWLAGQLDLAAWGAEVVVGTVRPRFDELTPEQIDAWHRTHDDGQSLGHVHGANLGVAADAYRRVGGFLAAPEHEDTDLVERLFDAGAIVVASEGFAVETSGRHVGRTPGGYARYLREDLLRAAGAVNPVT
jgi:glycosyltransferase involved in cell wall biosynthesis